MTRRRKHHAWVYARRILGQVLEHPANRDNRLGAVGRALRWQIRKRFTSKPLDIAFEGMVLRAHVDSGSASNVVYFTSRYDFHEMAFLTRYLRPGDGFLDIGANIGTYSLLAASVTGPGGPIVAFEPVPRMAARTRENFERNGLTDATVHQVAVGDHAGTVRFLDYDVSSLVDPRADAKLGSPAVDAAGSVEDRYRRGTSIEVTMVRIDAVVGQRPFAAAKLDVEGLELAALRGAEHLLAEHRPPVWLIELLPGPLGKHGVTVEQVVELMAAHGYTPGWFDADSEELRFGPGTWEEHGNALFVADACREAIHERLGVPQVGS